MKRYFDDLDLGPPLNTVLGADMVEMTVDVYCKTCDTECAANVYYLDDGVHAELGLCPICGGTAFGFIVPLTYYEGL
jgi:hypothetical protein